jgi:hypothetical protein
MKHARLEPADEAGCGSLSDLFFRFLDVTFIFLIWFRGFGLGISFELMSRLLVSGFI